MMANSNPVDVLSRSYNQTSRGFKVRWFELVKGINDNNTKVGYALLYSGHLGFANIWKILRAQHFLLKNEFNRK